MNLPQPMTKEDLRKAAQRGGTIYILNAIEHDGYLEESAWKFEIWNCSNRLIARGQVFSSKAKVLAHIKQLGWNKRDWVVK